MAALGWLMNLDFAASGSGAAPAPPAVDASKGAFILIGTGCWMLPILTVVLLGVR